MQGYDLDGTLAAVDLAQAKVKPMASIFASAPVIYTPTTDFVVLTARPHATPAERTATLVWLHLFQPHFTGIHYVATGRSAALAKSKGALITSLALTDYTDNNPDTLKALLAQGATAKLWQMSPGGRRTRYTTRTALAQDWAPTL